MIRCLLLPRLNKGAEADGYTLKEIGDHFGLHYSTVSGGGIISWIELSSKDPQLQHASSTPH
jgi:hypothetical protein